MKTRSLLLTRGSWENAISPDYIKTAVLLWFSVLHFKYQAKGHFENNCLGVKAFSVNPQNEF